MAKEEDYTIDVDGEIGSVVIDMPNDEELATYETKKEQIKHEVDLTEVSSNENIEYIDWSARSEKPPNSQLYSDDEFFYKNDKMESSSSSSASFFNQKNESSDKKQENPSDEKSKNIDKLMLGIGLTAAGLGIVCGVVGLACAMPVAILGLVLIISAATALMVSVKCELDNSFPGTGYYQPVTMFPPLF